MILSQLVNTLQTHIPFNTDLFTDDLEVVSLTYDSSIVSCETLTPHNLITGNFAHISGALSPNEIINLTQTRDVATAITIRDHDLTLNWQKEIEIIGANETDYNGIHALIGVPNRRTFNYSLTNNPVSPATGIPILLENLSIGYNGWHQITKVSDTVFSYPSAKVIGSPAYGDFKLRVNPRIAGVATIERAVASYTAQQTNKLWMFVLIENAVADHNRNVTNSQVAYFRRVGFYNQIGMVGINIYVFIPTKESVGGADGVDLSFKILPYLFKSILGLKLDYGLRCNPNDGIVYMGNSIYDYRNVYYVHQYTFQSTFILHVDDALPEDYTVALRDIYSSYKAPFNEETGVFVTDYINLDEKPL